MTHSNGGSPIRDDQRAPHSGSGAVAGPEGADAHAAQLPVVLAVTGASGAVYAARLLQILMCRRVDVHLTMSESGAAVIYQELGVKLESGGFDCEALFKAHDEFLGIDDANSDAVPLAVEGAPQAVDSHSVVSTQNALEGAKRHLTVHQHKDYFTPIASGSFLTGGMVICPCSGSTLSGIARSASQNLVQRAAEVHLKEQRKLIIVPRETPLSVFQLENLHRLATAGVVVLPAAPGWYHGVTGMLDLVDFVVARILDQLGIANRQIQRWKE